MHKIDLIQLSLPIFFEKLEQNKGDAMHFETLKEICRSKEVSPAQYDYLLEYHTQKYNFKYTSFFEFAKTSKEYTMILLIRQSKFIHHKSYYDSLYMKFYTTAKETVKELIEKDRLCVSILLIMQQHLIEVYEHIDVVAWTNFYVTCSLIKKQEDIDLISIIHGKYFSNDKIEKLRKEYIEQVSPPINVSFSENMSFSYQ